MRTIRSSRRLPVLVTVITLATATTVLGPPAPVLAANTLSNGRVAPGSGTTATSFVFQVDYSSTPPRRAAEAVWADVVRSSDGAVVTVPLPLVTGTSTDGTYRGAGALAAGSWQVTFRAQAELGVPDLDGGLIQVTGPSVTPSASPSSPSPSPIPTFDPTSPPSSAAPEPTPLPTADVTPAPPPVIPRPPATRAPNPAEPSPTVAPSATVLLVTPAPRASDADAGDETASILRGSSRLTDGLGDT